MKLIITTIGMGKSTYVKKLKDDYEVGTVPAVDLDFRMPFKSLTAKVKGSISNVINEFAKSGIVDVVLVNPEFVNPDAFSVGRYDIVLLYPKDVDAVKLRVTERDGDDTFANMIDSQMEVMRRMYKSHVTSHSMREATADGVEEFMSSDAATDGTPETSEVEELTTPTPEESVDEELREGGTDGDEQEPDKGGAASGVDLEPNALTKDERVGADRT